MADSSEVQIVRLQKRLDRERLARLETEEIAEKTLSELYLKQQELEARQEELRLMQEITVAANEADTLYEALQRALPLICCHTDWPIGHAWALPVDGEQTGLVSTKLWHMADESALSRFLQVTEETTFPKGVGLPGEVWATGEAIWIEDLAEVENFPRRSFCPDVGLRSGLAFPIMTGKRVVAVLEFFSQQVYPRDPTLLEVLSHIGTQMGRVVERERARSAIRWQAYHDALTSLPNRSLFQDQLAQTLAIAARHGHGAAVLFLDLDRFKQVNDTLGHAAGDRLLQGVARRLAGCLHIGDTLARMGGDEFTVILPNITHPEDALKVARKLLATLEVPLMVDGHDLFVSGSIGASIFPEDGQDAETLLRHADAAMYRSKAQGTGCQLYAMEMDAAALERMTLESQLRQAVTRQEFTLYYQPQFEMSTGRIVGVEALIRWRHPTLGLVPPIRFIPLAEETGLILPLGKWILEEATRRAAAWRQAGHDLRIAVNLSARQFEQPDLANSVSLVLQESRLPADALELEMTESVLMTRGESVQRTLHSLKALGVRIAVDDFGTGYSSLAYLRHFPVDVLKIDRAFVRGLGCEEVDTAIVRAVVDLAHAVDLTVVAEGVETEEQRWILKRLGCDLTQGYLFSQPLPEEELLSSLSKWESPSDILLLAA